MIHSFRFFLDTALALVPSDGACLLDVRFALPGSYTRPCEVVWADCDTYFMNMRWGRPRNFWKVSGRANNL